MNKIMTFIIFPEEKYKMTSILRKICIQHSNTSLNGAPDSWWSERLRALSMTQRDITPYGNGVLNSSAY